MGNLKLKYNNEITKFFIKLSAIFSNIAKNLNHDKSKRH